MDISLLYLPGQARNCRCRTTLDSRNSRNVTDITRSVQCGFLISFCNDITMLDTFNSCPFSFGQYTSFPIWRYKRRQVHTNFRTHTKQPNTKTKLNGFNLRYSQNSLKKTVYVWNNKKYNDISSFTNFVSKAFLDKKS